MTLRPRQRLDVDVAIVGAGFGGSLLALALRGRGMRVALLDRGRHPRFAIGESSTPLANLLIEELADRYDLPRLRPFSKWGTWQAAYPQVACGLKRGFSFFKHDAATWFADDATRARQLLVAASPHDGIADTHWYRADFDDWLVREAERSGVVYHEDTALDAPQVGTNAVALDGTSKGASLRIDARFLVDASGPRGYLWRALSLGDAPLEWLPPTQALYTHFRDVERWDAVAPPHGTPPYAPDDAALHHVLDGAWIWVLRFNNGVTSAGIAARNDVAEAYGLRGGSTGWARVLAEHPSIAAQFRGSTVVQPFVHAPAVAHRTATVSGSAWALLPSAAGVIDPLLSTGFPLTLLGIARLAQILERTHPGAEREAALRTYATATTAELRATEELVAALYSTMNDFALFKRLSLLYFAAASYTETMRRLGRADAVPGFLLHADPRFGPALRDLTRRARSLAATRAGDGTRQRLLDDITAAIAPLDVAGLTDASRRDWYPVRAEDLHAARARLGVTASEVDALLARCGFTPRTVAAGVGA